jgi:hypothetical protein
VANSPFGSSRYWTTSSDRSTQWVAAVTPATGQPLARPWGNLGGPMSAGSVTPTPDEPLRSRRDLRETELWGAPAATLHHCRYRTIMGWGRGIQEDGRHSLQGYFSGTVATTTAFALAGCASDVDSDSGGDSTGGNGDGGNTAGNQRSHHSPLNRQKKDPRRPQSPSVNSSRVTGCRWSYAGDDGPVGSRKFWRPRTGPRTP